MATIEKLFDLTGRVDLPRQRQLLGTDGPRQREAGWCLRRRCQIEGAGINRFRSRQGMPGACDDTSAADSRG